jgi:glycosyltransferase involved in cell wall biosynthesis
MLLIFDSHPVQYKAPVYRRLAQLRPGSFRVIYATDVTVRGHRDREFGEVVAWDTPLLEGYDHLVLHNERGAPFSNWRSLSGRGVLELLRRERPAAAILSQFLYAFDLAAYLGCLVLGIPIWIRQETQDEAFARPAWKSAVRDAAYRVAYRPVAHAFAFGILNREHLVRHGIAPERISFARYATPEPPGVDAAQRGAWRESVRKRFGVAPEETLVLFSGKFIAKKNPGLLLEALGLMTPEDRGRFLVLFVGAGPLETDLRAQAAEFPGRIDFAGFVNQSEIASFYAAADLLVLPSRRAGETWGLVVNEALQAGCGVVMTDAVGCHREFGGWERVRVIPEGDARACAAALCDLTRFPRDFGWCAEAMREYSIEAAAQAIAQRIDQLTKTGGQPS